MKSREVRENFLTFFKERGHAIVPSSSLLPDDPSVLLTTAGMQQFKKYFTGEANAERDFGSKNTASVQKSFRTSDIDEVGDESHLTFFEMLGNFSFGGYFKNEAIAYAHEFITKVCGLEIDYVSVFEGDTSVPEDKESAEIWKSLGVKKIKKFGREDNFWGPTGAEGPCGPTTEIYVGGVEIWNIVFNEYYQNADGSLRKLEMPGVDTGMGLERLAAAIQNKKNIFETDLFAPLMELLPAELSMSVRRVLADHTRGIAFLLSDGVRPSNKEAGYVLRRLMRRVITHEYVSEGNFSAEALLEKVMAEYSDFYKELRSPAILAEFKTEKEKFLATIKAGLKELEKLTTLSVADAFRLYESYGVPFEVIKELGGKKAEGLTREDFDKEFAKHQEKSRAGAEKKFGGHGLLLNTGELKAADEEELKKVTRLHTATHLLQQALRVVVGSEVAQAGSDITGERLRFDFTFPRKLTKEELEKTEAEVKKIIEKDLPVKFKEMPIEEAKKTGALYFFKEKYPDKVKVYYVGDSLGDAWSKEFCGGPHVTHTGEIGELCIIKEEAVGAGVRRIRAKIL